MKMKLAICTQDENYATRFINYFNVHYSDRIELVQLTDASILPDYVAKWKPDLCLIGIEMLGEMDGVDLGNALLIYLSNDKEEEIENAVSVYKYQKAEVLYKTLLNYYADRKTGVKKFKKRNANDAHTYVFCSPGSGAGATTVAIAFATKLAKERSVLYLNMQQYQNSDLVLQGEGSGKFGDVIFALKSKRTSLSLKMESLVKTSRENVCFFDSCDNPIDMMEIQTEDIEKLLNEVISGGNYQDVVIDIDNKMSEIELKIMDRADYILLVSDGTVSAGKKFDAFVRTMESIESRDNADLISKTRLFYNKFSNKTGTTVENDSIPVAGGCPKIDGVPMEGVVSRMSILEAMANLKNMEIG